MRTALIAVLVFVPALDLAAQGRPPQSDWSVMFGGGAVVAPDYPGSDEYRVLPLPFSQVMFRDRVYLGPSTTGIGGLGAYVVRTPRLDVAAELSIMENRPASRSDAPAGTDGRDLVAGVGAKLNYRTGPLEGTVGIAQGLNDDSGWLSTLELTYTQILSRRVIATAGVNTSFADGKQMRREFGVTEIEASQRAAVVPARVRRRRLSRPRGRRQPAGAAAGAGVAGSGAAVAAVRWRLRRRTLDRISVPHKYSL